MLKIELNKIPSLLEEGLLTRNQAVNFMAEFIFKNYPLFGLHKYDEDFREEILLEFLEKGGNLIDCYKSSIGNFFPYFYSQISSIVNKNLKKRAKQSIEELCSYHEEYSKVLQDRYKYEPISQLCCAEQKVPYNRKRVSPEDLQAALHSYTEKKERVLITLLLKYVQFYDEKNLYTICKALKLDYNVILEGIRICKLSLNTKLENQKLLTESRNKSYFYRTRYQSQLKFLTKEKDYGYFSDTNLKKKLNHHTHAWQNKNHLLLLQTSHLVTSNKLIGELLGICERQVRYYLSCAKNYKNILESYEE
ncbi:hypothetical protein [Treponema sp. C6A8]|uniref:hypothetical protein n=1 Tax=Treponema sp. C6A8 TaxID=1410609 RepID=UPI00047F6F40|nr:hypothetical protein [Treponema sp. C6A8]